MALRCVRWYLDMRLDEALESAELQLALLVLWGIYGISHIIFGNKKGYRAIWMAGAALTIIDIAKLLLVDLANTGTVTRIIAFFVAGLLLLFIGWAAPLPPPREKINHTGHGEETEFHGGKKKI